MQSLSVDPAAAHIVGFYTHESFVVKQIAEYVSEGVAAGEQVLVIVTKEHWTAVLKELDGRGIAHGHAVARGQLVIVDCEAVFEQIMENDEVDVSRFRTMLMDLLSGTGTKRMYGELVGCLADRGDIDGAARIEAVVHEISHTCRIPILCCYNIALQRPLAPAEMARLRHLHDRSFSEPSESQEESSRQFHAVRFYSDSMELSRIVAEFLGDGLASGDPAVVIATPSHAEQIATALQRRGFDIERLKADGRVICEDAEHVLAEFMSEGMPHPGRFRQSVGAVLASASNGRTQSKIRAYGEMVDVLWRQGKTVAATRLETLWNQLAKTHSLSLLCGYSMGHFYKNTDAQAICEQHSHILSLPGEAARV